MTTITIIDTSLLGEKRAWSLDMPDEILSLRELICRRISQEVSEYNAKLSGLFYGLVQPTAAECILNGYRIKTPRTLDWQVQYEKAIEAFTRRGYIVLVNEHQVTDLDASIELYAGSEATFLKLIPLIGG